MHVFMTGATGYVGSRLLPLLQARGHEVSALAQDEAKAGHLRARGVEPVAGRLQDADVLARAAGLADAVVNLGFIPDFARFAEVVEIERRGNAAIVEALRGSGRPIVGFSGYGMYDAAVDASLDAPPPADPAVNPFAIRWRGTEPLRDEAAGVRGITLVLAVWVYGHGASVFVPHLLTAARERGESVYLAPGTQRASEVHVDDVADAILRALEHPDARGTYLVADECCSTLKEKAEAVAIAAGGPPVWEVGMDEAQVAWGPAAGMIAMPARVPGRRLMRELGWQPRGPGLVEDVARGSYARRG